ncbi:AbrB family transcriptional regulator [Pseudomonas gingeri]|uniref:AbrB family transcriptional regulator n=1 Tax=Pseudomonas gingeri TaxID=117681 RepID=UPI0015A06FA2|nr:AbrB family transcriptional regulator [Pseudomonas gingeri]NWA24606.1 AbrB family transcriptional regulator [Pseudomonas gingeri]
MSNADTHITTTSTGKLASAWQWIVLLGLSTLFAVALTWVGIPAALLLGPMLGAVIVAITFIDTRVQVPRSASAFAQGLLGCMIAKTLVQSFAGASVGNWPLFVLGVVGVIVAGGLLGWGLTRLRVLPGTTAIWGLSPGAATVMILMAENAGADAQLVACMQYTRVILVAVIATLITHFTGAGVVHEVHSVVWFPSIDWLPLAQTLPLVAAGPLVARLAKIPVAALLVPMFGGIFLARQGLISIEMPHWLLALGYAAIGWRIGLPFTRPLVKYALKAFPAILASTLVLIMICGCLAAVFVFAAGIDPLTAYLATSPGGADSVAIIAASSHVDVPFVMTMQMARFGVVLLVGPTIAAFISRRIAPTGRATET